MQPLKFRVFDGRYSICQLPADFLIGDWTAPGFVSIIRTPDELAVVCLEEHAPVGAKVEVGWRLFRVEGQLDFSLIGILAEITRTLAEARISVYALSTFNTDYLLVRDLDGAVAAFRSGGHQVD